MALHIQRALINDVELAAEVGIWWKLNVTTVEREEEDNVVTGGGIKKKESWNDDGKVKKTTGPQSVEKAI